MLYWFFVILFGVLTIACFIWILTESGFGDEDMFIPIILFIICGTITACILFNVDYTITEDSRIYPSQTSIMSDEEEAIIKYDNHRWEYDEHLEYSRIVDSSFYIQKYKCYNVFGSEEPVYYKLKTFDSEEEASTENGIPIEL